MKYNKSIKGKWENIGDKIVYDDHNVYKSEVYKIERKSYEYLTIKDYSIVNKYIELYNIEGININDILYDSQGKDIGRITNIVSNRIFVEQLDIKLDNIILLEKKYNEYSLNKGNNIIYPQNDKNDIFIKLNNKDINEKKDSDENQIKSINSENIVTVFITTCLGFVIGTYIFNRHLK